MLHLRQHRDAFQLGDDLCPLFFAAVERHLLAQADQGLHVRVVVVRLLPEVALGELGNRLAPRLGE